MEVEKRLFFLKKTLEAEKNDDFRCFYAKVDVLDHLIATFFAKVDALDHLIATFFGKCSYSGPPSRNFFGPSRIFLGKWSKNR